MGRYPCMQAIIKAEQRLPSTQFTFTYVGNGEDGDDGDNEDDGEDDDEDDDEDDGEDDGEDDDGDDAGGPSMFQLDCGHCWLGSAAWLSSQQL